MDHEPLSLGDGKFIMGGCCVDHEHIEADVYVGLDDIMLGESSLYPWSTKEGVLFPITDMRTPTDFSEFDKMIDWIQNKIVDGKKVHVGCLGGHGRTGLVLSALTYKMMGIEDAITYVREHYCSEAVETTAQVQWLNRHYGIKMVEISHKLGFSSYYDQLFNEMDDFGDLDEDMPFLNDMGVFPCDEESTLSIFSKPQDKVLDNKIDIETFNSITLNTTIENLGKVLSIASDEQLFGIVDKEIKEKGEIVGYHLTLYYMSIYFDEAYILLSKNKDYAYISSIHIRSLK